MVKTELNFHATNIEVATQHPDLYPYVKLYNYTHIDLREKSKRVGVDGPRYVGTRDGCIGDTNTGLMIAPRKHNDEPGFFPEITRRGARMVEHSRVKSYA